MTQNELTMTFLFCSHYDIIIWAGQDINKITLYIAVEQLSLDYPQDGLSQIKNPDFVRIF